MTAPDTTGRVAVPRPLPVSIIAVMFVLYGLVSLVPKAMVFLSPEIREGTAALTEAMTTGGVLTLSMELQLAHALAGSMVFILAGVFLWAGRNWARWLALAWMVGSLALYLLLTGPVVTFYLKIPLFLVLTYVLTARKTSAFLRGRPVEA